MAQDFPKSTFVVPFASVVVRRQRYVLLVVWYAHAYVVPAVAAEEEETWYTGD